MEKNSDRLPILVTTITTALSRVLGFFRIFVVAYFFGAGKQTDVLHLVFSLINNLRKIIGEGIFSAAIVPVLTAPNQNSLPERNKTIHNFLIVQFSVLLPLIAYVALFPEVVSNTFFSFPTEGQTRSAASFLRIAIFYLFTLSLSATFIAILHSHKRFFLASVHPMLFSITAITSIVLFHRTLGILSLAAGAIVGGMFQLTLYIMQYRALGYNFAFKWVKQYPPFIQIMKNCLPLLLTSFCGLLAQQVSISIASSLETGSGTAMSNALVFFQLPIGIFAATLLVVFFPLFSSSFNNGQFFQMGKRIEKLLSALLYLQLPCMLILMFFGLQIIKCVLEWGSFTSSASLQSYEVLYIYATAVPGASIFMFTQRLCFACSRFIQGLYITALCTIIDIVLTILLANTSLGIRGIALAFSIAYTFTALLMLIYLRISLPYFSLRRCSASFFKAALGSFLPLIPFLLLRKEWNSLFADLSSFRNVVFTLIGILLYLGMLLLIYRCLSVDLIGIFKEKYIQEDS